MCIVARQLHVFSNFLLRIYIPLFRIEIYLSGEYGATQGLSSNKLHLAI